MRSVLEEFACGGFPEPDGGALVVLWAYFDESGTDGALGHTVISGFLAPISIWVDFKREWRAALDSDNVQTFHYIDCNNRKRGSYRGWKYHEQSIPHLHKMAEVLTSYPLIAISVGHSGDFDAVMKRHPGWEVRFPTPYSLCFEMMIQLLRTDIAPIEGLPVAIIMSDQAQFEPRAQEIYKHYKHAGLWPEIAHLGYSDPRVVLPLQAADMLAFETRRFCWKEQEDYWKEQPLLSRWLNLTYRWQRATYSVAFDDDGLDFFLSQEEGQYLKTPSSLGETRAAAPGPENV